VVHFKINHSVSANDPPKKPVLNSGPARSPRRKVVIEGTFHSHTGTYRIGIKNLSCTGALIRSELPLKVGKEGVLEAEHLDNFCKVVWTDGTLYGLQFDEPLRTEVVLELHRITGDDLKRAETAAAREWWDTQAR